MFPLFSQIVEANSCVEPPQAEAYQFACILKRIVSFSHCYQITECDPAAPRSGWCGFEIKPQLSGRTFSCLRRRVSPRRGHLPVLPGAKRRWPSPSDTTSLCVEFGEWRCPLAGINPGGQVSPLSCVYLLASCSENLPINCMLILPVYDWVVSVVLRCRLMRMLDFQLITTTSWLFTSPLLLWSYLLPCIKTLISSCMHNITYGLFGKWSV